MSTPLVHLRHGHVSGADLTARALCGTVAWSWTDDSQAVTCQRCVAHIELQPA